MRKWYFIEDGERRGPYTIAELKGQNITPYTLVWTDSMKDWEKAKDVGALQGTLMGKSSQVPAIQAYHQKNSEAKEESVFEPFLASIHGEWYFGYELAKRRERLFAYLVEAFIVSVTFLLLFLVMGVDFENVPEKPFIDIHDVLYSAVTGVVMGAVLYPIFSGNLGHAILGMKVISSVTGEDYKSPLQGAVRETLKYVLGYLIVPFLVIFFDKRKQTLIDMMTKTLVVKKRN